MKNAAQHLLTQNLRELENRREAQNLEELETELTKFFPHPERDTAILIYIFITKRHGYLIYSEIAHAGKARQLP